MYQAILFDLDGTLKISVPSGMEMFAEYARRLGISIDERAVKAGIRWSHWYWAQSPALLEDLSLDDEQALWTRYTRRLLEAVVADQADDGHAMAITQQFADYAPEVRLNYGACETLTGLVAAGYTIGLVSNRRNPLDQVLADLGLEEMFALTMAAGEIDIYKPDPGILCEAMLRVSSEPESTVYVGDNYYADVACAREAGVTPVLIDPAGIFPEAECRVIRQLTGLLDWLV
jgi:HAD superfamily hydrolase (TIGR01549 family)